MIKDLQEKEQNSNEMKSVPLFFRVWVACRLFTHLFLFLCTRKNGMVGPYRLSINPVLSMIAKYLVGVVGYQ